jgi:hypothetical protein
VDSLLRQKAILRLDYFRDLQLELMPVGGDPIVEKIANPARQKGKDPYKAPSISSEPVDPEDRVGSDPEPPFRRLVIFSKHKAIRPFKLFLRPRQNLARRLTSQWGEQELLFPVDFDDMLHRFMAQGTFIVEKYDMVIHFTWPLPAAAV